jgi:tetratricopeptide (TPR) repeat protein
MIASYLLEGRVRDAQASRSRNIERLRASGNDKEALHLTQAQMVERRLLGEEPLPAGEVAWVEEILQKAEKDDAWIARVRAGLALGRLAKDPKAGRKAARRPWRRSSRWQRSRRGVISAFATRCSWRRCARAGAARDARRSRAGRPTDRAVFNARAHAALDAGLALEAAGRFAEAEGAYKLALDPDRITHQTLGWWRRT